MMNRKNGSHGEVIWSCTISMLLGNANVSAQETHPSLLSFLTCPMHSLWYTVSYVLFRDSNVGTLYTFDTSATERII